ncbi:hypothetical protein C2S52_006284 [Perilla frutescens var. hirtella]|nr:hypothetical protein C2S51_009502 [Perilla frutescens var. frutescens]KAH6786732.1 hypothetical protein C2S52_006284 [Perilla frutescens var. hirtella]
MSPLVETLVQAKIYPLTRPNEEQDEEEKKTMIEGTSSQKATDFCLIDQEPHKDKGGKRPSKWKQLILERWNVPVGAAALKSKEEGVEMVGISIICRGRPEILLSEEFISSSKTCLFTLKEGTDYRLKFSFIVSNNVVSGLKYVNTLWKAGIRVDRTTVILGSYSPQEKAYEIELVEETLPCGLLVRGCYSARTKVTDTEGKCYMDTNYCFNIQKNWPSIS